MDLFSTSNMLKAVDQLPMSNLFLINHFFPNVQTEESNEIHFDVIKKTRRLAPFVSPVVAGQIMESQGFETKTFEPAYIKDKRVFDSTRPLKRLSGESIGGSFAPNLRIERLLVNEIADQINMVDRRLEVMAAEALRTGALTITGKKYPTQNVNFGRDPELTITLAGAALWSDPASNPLDDLQDWSELVLKKSGVSAHSVVMSVDVWKIFRSHPTISAELDRMRSSSTMNSNAQNIEGGELKGEIHGFNIYVYTGWYIDDAGIEQSILPAGTVLLSSPKMDGVRAFGSILDFESNYRALPYFPKSWVTEDPSVRYLLMQSAPLVVPTRIDATLSAGVL